MKPYTGGDDETCPLFRGKCKKYCPTCKFQQEFTCTDNVTGAVKSHWDCALAFQTQLLMEANQIGISGKQATDQLRKETVEEHRTLLHGNFIVSQRMLDRAVKNGREIGTLAAPATPGPCQRLDDKSGA